MWDDLLLCMVQYIDNLRERLDAGQFAAILLLEDEQKTWYGQHESEGDTLVGTWTIVTDIGAVAIRQNQKSIFEIQNLGMFAVKERWYLKNLVETLWPALAILVKSPDHSYWMTLSEFCVRTIDVTPFWTAHNRRPTWNFRFVCTSVTISYSSDDTVQKLSLRCLSYDGLLRQSCSKLTAVQILWDISQTFPSHICVIFVNHVV